jgi:hypothetical protein
MPITKQFTIELDIINGTVDYKNPDNLTYFQVCGMIDYAKMMIMREFLEEAKD